MASKLAKFVVELRNTKGVAFFNETIPTHLTFKGTINYIKPMSQFPLPSSSNIDLLLDKALKWILKHNLMMGQVTPEVIQKTRDYLETPVIFSLFIQPLVDPNSTQVHFTILFVVFLFIFDDFFIESFQGSKINKYPLHKRIEWGGIIKIASDIFIQALKEGFNTELGASGSSIFEKYPFLRNIYGALKDMYQLGVDTIPDFEEKSIWWISELKNSFTAAIWSLNLQGISEESFKYIRKFASAALPTFEIILLGGNTFPTVEHRQNIIFKRWMDSIAGGIAFTNDIMSIIKELHDGDDMNVIIFNWKRGQGDIQQCFRDTIDLVNSQVSEIISLSQKLKEEFPGDETINHLIKQGELFIDGHVHWYTKYKKRYGLVNNGNT